MIRNIRLDTLTTVYYATDYFFLNLFLVSYYLQVYEHHNLVISESYNNNNNNNDISSIVSQIIKNDKNDVYVKKVCC